MYFLVIGDNLMNKYNTICDKTSPAIKKKLYSESA